MVSLQSRFWLWLEPWRLKKASTLIKLPDLEHNLGNAFYMHRKQESLQNCYMTASEKTNTQWAKNWMGWIEILIVTENVKFYLFYIVCDAMASLRRQTKLHCKIEICTYYYILLNEMKNKWEGGRQRGMAVHFEFPMEWKQLWGDLHK